MAVYCRTIIQNYLLKIVRRKIAPEDIYKIKKYLQILDLLGNHPLQSVVSINQTATALRFKLQFNALLMGKDDIGTENRIFYLYGESSSIEGYVSTFRDVAIKYSFLSRFHKDRALSKVAILYAFYSLKLAYLVGDIYGVGRALLLLSILGLTHIANILCGF